MLTPFTSSEAIEIFTLIRSRSAVHRIDRNKKNRHSMTDIKYIIWVNMGSINIRKMPVLTPSIDSYRKIQVSY